MLRSIGSVIMVCMSVFFFMQRRLADIILKYQFCSKKKCGAHPPNGTLYKLTGAKQSHKFYSTVHIPFH